MRLRPRLLLTEVLVALALLGLILWQRPDVAAFAAAKPLAHPPGSVWAYSSGSSNILARILRDLFDGDLAAQVRWSRERLFDPVGMRTAFIETDASGSFIGSSFVFASARDWARFGQLQLQGGVWEGRRLLPEGWAAMGPRRCR